MASDDAAVTTSYLEHLTNEDLAFLCQPNRPPGSAGGGSTDDFRALVRSRRGGIEGLLGNREVFEGLFIADRGSGPLMIVSPFLAFAVAVQRARLDLTSTTYVPEWVGVGRRTPVFDVPRLMEFVSAPWRGFFLTELLAVLLPCRQWVSGRGHPTGAATAAVLRARPRPPGRPARRGPRCRTAWRLPSPG